MHQILPAGLPPCQLSQEGSYSVRLDPPGLSGILGEYKRCSETVQRIIDDLRHKRDGQVDAYLRMRTPTLWLGFFNDLFFNLFGMPWILIPSTEMTKPLHTLIWQTTMYEKVFFFCEDHQREWTSEKGSVDFQLYLTPTNFQLHFKLSTQKCHDCPKHREIPSIWYPHGIVKVDK
ncbi:unnamed protein product [Protopolystoma xenopodis]|uniref:3CxxC-type domain-containing protein n=1 Tax=Protopolystoma xenopodis TaxID=117903 RepID=A0A448WDP4_9PLAT|nr:unnamed protein product [Protopolystoma xenopodis]